MNRFTIGGLQKISLIDYPRTPAAIVFTQGCNFRCGYCHNPELTCLGQSEGIMSEEALYTFLSSRVGLLQGVVISGGEPTLQPRLISVMKWIKEMGFLVKLDSNGSNPEVLERAYQEGCVDYVAMDIKAPMSKYRDISRYGGLIERIKTSQQIIMDSGIEYEFRTTIVREQLSLDDIYQIGREIEGAKMYALQQFIPTEMVDNTFQKYQGYSTGSLEEIRSTLEGDWVRRCIVRQ